MPGFDRNGPRGYGPGTGRGMGPCFGNNEFRGGYLPFFGCGFGRGRRCGRGRGFGWGTYPIRNYFQ